MKLTRDQSKTMIEQGALLLLRQMPAEEITPEAITKAIEAVGDGITGLYTGLDYFGWVSLKREVSEYVGLRLGEIEYTVIVESDVKRESGNLPFKLILAKRAKSPDPALPYVTWVAYEREKDTWANAYGHYDLTFCTACIDFEDRCRRLGVPYGKSWGRGMQAVLSDSKVF